MAELWKNDVIENAYYDAEPKTDKLANFANISFFIKAKSKAEVTKILDELTVVEKNIASYTIHRVGPKWLGRKTEAVNESGATKSFVSVWTARDLIKIPNADQIVKNQSDAILKLWNEGIIENIYFDMEGEQAKTKLRTLSFLSM